MSFWRSVRTGYVQLAILFLTTTLLFLFINLAALPLIETPHQAPNPVVARHGKHIYEAYPDLTRPQVDSLLNQTYPYPGFDYEPFAQFKERPRRETYVNVSYRGGFRFSRLQGPWPLDTTFFNVFVFGGSTTFGYGLADAETIPTRIQDHMNLRSQGKPARVYNFGRGYYYSAQERVFFEKLVHEGHLPDLAIFIDGTNDISNWARFDGIPYFSRHLSGFFRQMGQNSYWSIDLPLLVYLRQLNRTNKQISRQQDDSQANVKAPIEPSAGGTSLTLLMSRTAQQTPPSTPSTEQPSQGLNWEEVIDRYLRNQRMIRAVADDLDIETLFVWQPVPYYKYAAETYHVLPELAPSIPWAKPYQLIERAAALANDPRFLVLSSMQQHEEQNLYVDNIHYNKYFSNKMALRITHHYLTQLAPHRLAPAFRTSPGITPAN